MKVLLVEDSEALLSALAEQIETQGHQVVACSRFEQAKDCLRDHQPDALVTDVRLGAFNGLHLVLLARTQSPAMHIVVYSAHEDPIVQAEAQRLGATFLDKPVAAGPLLQALTATVDSEGAIGKSTEDPLATGH